MLLATGILLLLLSAALAVCALKQKSKLGATHIRMMPLLFVLSFMSAIGGLTCLIGGANERVTISVFGHAEDRPLYQNIRSASGKRYWFFVMNQGENGHGLEAISCNAGQLSDFINEIKERMKIDITATRLDKCPTGNSFTNFIHPHITLYLR